MSEIKTLEEKFLADFKALEIENTELRIELEQIKKQKEKIEERETPSPRLLECPIETIYMNIAGGYEYKNIEELTPERIRKACETREGLEEIAKLKTKSYLQKRLLHIEYTTFPYTLKLMGSTYGLDFYYDTNDSYTMTNYRIEKSSTKPMENRYYTSDRYNELYEYGLKLLKKQLLAYVNQFNKEKSE